MGPWPAKGDFDKDQVLAMCEFLQSTSLPILLMPLESMQVSIITPTFNAAPFIEDCVANVHSQGDVVLEHIIVDGGSTDGSVEKIAELMRTRSTLRYLEGPDRGQSDALNKGVATAKGDIIGVLNVDDSYQPSAVARAAAALAQLKAPAFVVGDCKLIDADSMKWNRPKDLRFEALMLGYDYAQWPNNPAAYFYHRSAHQVVGDYDVDDHHAMDLDFVFRCARRIKMRYVGEHWGNFVLRPGCKTFEDSEGQARQTALFQRFHRSMTDAERRRMDRIKTSKSRVLATKGYLKQFAPLRHLNDRLRPVR